MIQRMRIKLSPPRHIHSSDKILFLQDEILALLHDIEGEDSKEGGNVLYAKADSKRLKKECDFISKTWDAVTAKEVHPGADKFTIQHEFQIRNDPKVTYHPAKSNIRHA